MKLILISNEDSQINEIIISSITIISGLRNAIDTDSDMLVHPPNIENNKISIKFSWAEEVSEEDKNNFKQRLLNSINFIVAQSDLKYEISWL